MDTIAIFSLMDCKYSIASGLILYWPPSFASSSKVMKGMACSLRSAAVVPSVLDIADQGRYKCATMCR